MAFLSRLFGKGPDAQYQAVITIQNDEKFQNALNNDYVKSKISQASGCDTITGSTGEFGFSASNPIPVNGPIGELAYLSKLRAPNGERLFFHRVGSGENSTDSFEVVTFCGSNWYVLYLNMYFPRRSRRAPEGFTLSPEPCPFTGFTRLCANFPYDFVEAKVANAGSGYGALNVAYAPTSLVQPYLERGRFERPVKSNTIMG